MRALSGESPAEKCATANWKVLRYFEARLDLFQQLYLDWKLSIIGQLMRYFEEVNILRAIAVLAVISIHASEYFKQMNTFSFLAAVDMAVDTISHFAVPLFVFISGFVLYNKYSDTIEPGMFYKKRLMSIVPPYLIFSTFYLALRYVDSILFSNQSNLDVPHILYWYGTGGCFYHLWFFVLIIQLYLLYPAILWIYRYCDLRGRSYELLFVALLVGVFYQAGPISDIFAQGIAAHIPWVTTKFVGYLFYFILGIIVRSRYEELLLRSTSSTLLYCIPIPLLCCTVMGTLTYAQPFGFDMTTILPVAGQYWNWTVAVLTPVYYVMIFALCYIVSLRIVSHKTAVSKFVEKIGHYSFGIYLIHAFILYAIVQVFAQFGFDWNNWLFYPLTFILTLFLSIFSVEVLLKLPYSNYIVGSTR